MRNYFAPQIYSENRFSVPRRKAFHNKKPVFKDFEFFENRFFLFTKDNICAKKSLRDSGRKTRPLRRICLKHKVFNGRI